jgi:hypothetical protein
VTLSPRQLNDSLNARYGNDVFRTGRTGNLQTSVSGGSAALRYYVAVNRDEEQGVERVNRLNRSAYRVNLNASPANAFEVATSMGYTAGRTYLPDRVRRRRRHVGDALLVARASCTAAPTPERAARLPQRAAQHLLPGVHRSSRTIPFTGSVTHAPPRRRGSTTASSRRRPLARTTRRAAAQRRCFGNLAFPRSRAAPSNAGSSR